MKTVTVPGKRVEDIGGLFYGLVENKFEVENVGMNKDGVYVYLHDAEEKDPTPIIEEWVGKPIPSITRSLVERRKILNVEVRAKRAQREAEEKAKAEANAEAKVEAQPLPALPEAEAPKPQTIFARIFRKLW